MTATTMKDVSTLLETMLQEQTLSLDAMEGIRKLKERADKADQEITQLTQRNNEQSGRLVKLEGDLSVAREQLTQIADREKAVQKREDAIHQLEMKAAVSRAEADAYRTSMSIVFAPNIVREAVMKYGSISNPGGGHSGTNESGTVSHTQGYARPGDPDANNNSGAQPKNTL